MALVILRGDVASQTRLAQDAFVALRPQNAKIPALAGIFKG
jgi:hypothetical protein